MLAGCGEGGGLVTGRPSDYRWGVADPRRVPPPMQWPSGETARSAPGFRAAGAPPAGLKRGEKTWRDRGAKPAGSRGRRRNGTRGIQGAPPCRSCRTCQPASPHLTFPPCPLCAVKGWGPRAGKEQVRKRPGLNSQKGEWGKPVPPTWTPHPPGGALGGPVLISQAHETADRVRVFGEWGRES